MLNVNCPVCKTPLQPKVGAEGVAERVELDPENATAIEGFRITGAAIQTFVCPTCTAKAADESTE